MQLARANALGSGPLTISGAVVDLDGVNATVGALSGDSFALITNNGFSGSTLTVNSSSGAVTTYAGTISDGNSPVALVLEGPGTLVLTGTGAYSGGTTVDAGTLIADSSIALPGGFELDRRRGLGCRRRGAGRRARAGAKCADVVGGGCGTDGHVLQAAQTLETPSDTIWLLSFPA